MEIEISLALLLHSVWDPEPDQKDPHVFWPPGSGSIIQVYGSGSGSGILTFSHKCIERTEIMLDKIQF
jgi:hypothetical protein